MLTATSPLPFPPRQTSDRGSVISMDFFPTPLLDFGFGPVIFAGPFGVFFSPHPNFMLCDLYGFYLFFFPPMDLFLLFPSRSCTFVFFLALFFFFFFFFLFFFTAPQLGLHLPPPPFLFSKARFYSVVWGFFGESPIFFRLFR